MRVNLKVTIDKKELERFGDLAKNSPFALAKALTLTAKDAQLALKGEAAGTFHLRNSWVPQGIRINPATKASLQAEVGSIDKYMGRHVVGDDKPAARALSIRGKRTGGRIASGGLLIPAYDSIGEVDKHQRFRSRLRRIDGQKRKTFQIVVGGGNRVFIVRRKTKKRNPLEVLATLRDEARITERWDIEMTTAGVVGARFGEHFAASITKV